MAVNEQQKLALSLAQGLKATAANIDRVARQTSPGASSWAFLQWELRGKASLKELPKSEEMLFTREALEQASHYRVAQYHASRFPAGALVADLTTGIGADLLALAARGPAIGYEIDQERLTYTDWNLGVNSRTAELRLEDSTKTQWDFQFAFADPARRVAGRRMLHPSGFAPDPMRFVERSSELKLLIVKLSPLLPDSYLQGFVKRLEFISFGGECREALAYLGTEVQSGRFAIHLESGSVLPASELQVVDEPKQYFYEADPAAIRSHALGALNFLGLGDSNGYLTGDDQRHSPWLKSYRTLAFGKFDLKLLKAKLREMRIGEVVVKTRATEIDVNTVARQLRGEGGPGIIAFYPVGRSIRYAILEKIDK